MNVGSSKAGLLFAAFVAAVLVVPSVSDAQNQPLQTTTTVTFSGGKAKGEWFVTQENRTVLAPLVPKEPTNWPGSCGAKPTKAQCTNEDFWKLNACAKDAGANGKAVKDYCVYVMQMEFNSLAGNLRPAHVPVTDPVVPFPSLAQGRRVERSKRIPAGPITNVKRRGFSRVKSPNKAFVPANAPRGSNFTPRTAIATGTAGTYATQQMTAIIADQPRYEMFRDSFDQWGTASNLGKATLANQLTQTSEWLMAKPPFVTPGAGVNKCEEYAYKKFGNWSLFQYAAKRMNRNWRNIYKIAMDPDSPVFINSTALKQIGTNEQALDWKYAKLPGVPSFDQATQTYYTTPVILPNAFASVKPDFIERPDSGVSQADKAAIWKVHNARKNTWIKAKSDTSPLGLHREAKQALDSRWGNPLDEELSDNRNRTSLYIELAARREVLVEKINCAAPSDPCFICHDPPPLPPSVQRELKGGVQLPGFLANLKAKVSGAPVSYPSDIFQIWETATPYEQQQTLVNMQLTNDVRTQNAAGLAQQRLNGGAAQGGMKKEKFDAYAQIKPAQTPTTPPPPLTQYGQCMADILATKPAMEATVAQMDKNLIAMVVNEIRNPKGCMIDPGPDATNACDWDYELFAGLAINAYAEALQKSVDACRTSVGNATAAYLQTTGQNGGYQGTFDVVKSAKKQVITFPCVQRRDFSTSAPELTKFLGVSGSFTGEICEVERRNKAVQDIQSEYADYFEGLEWVGGSGKVRDSESNGLRLGDTDSLGAEFKYDAFWELARTKTWNNTGDTMKGCGFEGQSSMLANTKVLFFGDTLDLLYTDGGVKAQSNPGRVKHTARYLDIENGSQRYLQPQQVDRALAANEGYVRPMAPVSLGDEEVSFMVNIAGFNVRITFGFAAQAGMQFAFAGRSGDNCSDASLKAPSNFKLLNAAYPFVQADAYADAALDYGIASAGVRLDLTLLRFSLPMGIHISNVQQDGWSFQNGGGVHIGMLDGELSGYVSFGPPGLEVTVSVPILGWQGFHESLNAFGINRGVPAGAVRALLAKFIDAGSGVVCEPTTDNKACSQLTHPDRPIPSNPPCSSQCGNDQGGQEYKKVEGKSEWHLCRFSRWDSQRVPTYHRASCERFAR